MNVILKEKHNLFCRECGFDGGDCYPQEGCVIPEGIDELSLGKVSTFNENEVNEKVLVHRGWKLQ